MSATATSQNPRTLDIDFLYIDLTTCTRCRGTDENLARALDLVRSTLTEAGVTVNLRKVLVDSEEKALEHRFLSSPTIRVNGQDVALGTKESRCGSCSDVAGASTDCRVWVYEGREYTEAPERLLVDAILRAADSPAVPEDDPGSPEGRQKSRPAVEARVPENLLRFFAAKARGGDGPCCPSTSSVSCCGAESLPSAPVAKAAGCGCAA